MGYKYLAGKKWEDVTRDERFFCHHLCNLLTGRNVNKLVAYIEGSLKKKTKFLEADIWEVGFEVCFYRDLRQFRNKQGELFSPKRTFDLVLFGKKTIVIIEAKAQQGFTNKQLAEFKEDSRQVKKETGVKQVLLVGLASSKYSPSPETLANFDCYLTWKEVAEKIFKNDRLLMRADGVYAA